jgi:hypothetical protein
MYTLEVYVRNPDEVHRITSFLQENRIAYTKRGATILNEESFYSNYLSSEAYVIPSSDFARLCGKQNLNGKGEIRVKDIYLFLCDQLQNPNCFFLESLMNTPEFVNALPEKGL